MSDINWGQYALVDNHIHRFKSEPEWYWEIRPITSGMELAYSRFLNHKRVKRFPDGSLEEFPPVWTEIAHRQIALCFSKTNIPQGDAKEGEDEFKPIIKEGAALSKIEGILTLMPPDLVDEIWRAVGKAYPIWGPADLTPEDDNDDDPKETSESN